MNKKIGHILKISSVLATATPVIAAVSCGETQNHEPNIPNPVTEKIDPKSLNLALNLKIIKTLLDRKWEMRIVKNAQNHTASEIARRITDVITLKDELNIDLTQLSIPWSKFKISATGSNDGKIIVNIGAQIKDTTYGAINVHSKPIKVHSNAEIAKKANEIQASDLDIFKNKISVEAKKQIKIPNEKVSEIAKRIIDVATLKTELGIDIFKLASIANFKSLIADEITAKGDAKGHLQIIFTTITKKATHPKKYPKILIKLDSDNLRIHNNNLAMVKKRALKIKDKAYWMRASVIAKMITKLGDVQTLKNELGIDLSGITGSTLKISATATRDGLITVKITITTKNVKETNGVNINKSTVVTATIKHIQR